MSKLISKKTFHTIELMLETGGRSYSEIAATAGVEQSLVCTIARGKHSYQCDSAKRGSLPNYLPTPEQIETECARLRATRKTSEAEKPSRRRGKQSGVGMAEPERIKKEMARDVAYVLGSPLHYRTKRAVLKNVLWAWTTFHGKYKGCRYWTPAAVEHLEQCGIKGLRHEHAVPRKLLIEVLFQMDSPQEDDVFKLLDRLAIGVVVTINEQKRLDLEHKTTMPPEFDDEQGDPWLRFKVCDIEVVERPDWKG